MVGGNPRAVRRVESIYVWWALAASSPWSVTKSSDSVKIVICRNCPSKDAAATHPTATFIRNDLGIHRIVRFTPRCRLTGSERPGSRALTPSGWCGEETSPPAITYRALSEEAPKCRQDPVLFLPG